MKALAIAMLVALTPTIAQADAKAGEKKAQLCLLCHKAINPPAYIPVLEGNARVRLQPDQGLQREAASRSRHADEHRESV